MDNLKIREFEQAIINFVNKSDLPVEVKRLCLTEITKKIEVQANQELQKEVMQRDAAEKTSKTEESEVK